MRFDLVREDRHRIEALSHRLQSVFDCGSDLTQRARRRVDRERGLVREEVTRHRAQHEREGGMHARHEQRLDRRFEAVLVVVCDDDRRGLVGAVDGELFRDVVGGRAVKAGRAHDDHRFRRQVDVLLVFGDVARDRLVAEL